MDWVDSKECVLAKVLLLILLKISWKMCSLSLLTKSDLDRHLRTHSGIYLVCNMYVHKYRVSEMDWVDSKELLSLAKVIVWLKICWKMFTF